MSKLRGLFDKRLFSPCAFFIHVHVEPIHHMWNQSIYKGSNPYKVGIDLVEKGFDPMYA